MKSQKDNNEPLLQPIAEVKYEHMSESEGPKVETGLRRKALMLTSVLALIALVVSSLFGDRGFLELLQQRRKTRALQHEIEDLGIRNSHLASEIRSLREDARSVEKLAREQLGLARPGETVFLIRPASPSAEH